MIIRGNFVTVFRAFLVELFTDTFSNIISSWLRSVNVSLGGHTVTFGKDILVIGRVSIVVVIGLSAQV